MAEKTIIAWTDHTFNIAWGCFKVSPGCKHCYADTLSTRYGQRHIWGPPATSDRRTFGAEHWRKPVLWNADSHARGRRDFGGLATERQRVFSSSMCDIFEDHPTIARERAKLWDLIRRTPWLDWQLLTKRADRIAQCLPGDWWTGWPHVWLGVSIENDEYTWRADALRTIPAAVRFISYEPALGPVPSLDLTGIDWVITGGESGKGYREMDVQWARDLRARCDAAGVAFFYKQSSHYFTERGIELDGQVVRFYPTAREV